MPNSGKLNVAWLYDDSLDRDDGVAQYVKTLGAWMSDQGHDVSYLVGQSKISSWHGSEVFSLSKNLHVRWGGNRMSIPVMPKRKSITALINARRFDVVHVTLPYSPLMAQLVINRLPKQVMLFGTWHIYPAGRGSEVGSRILKPVYGRSLKRFDQFISVSSAAQEFASKIFKVDSMVLPNVIKLPDQQTKSTQLTGKRIVFLGRLVKRKGVSYLIQAFAGLLTRMPDIELIIAGDGPMRQKLEFQVSTLNIKDSVKFLGHVSEPQKYELLASADVACFPSLYGESFGVVLIEAMAAGAKTVLGGDNPGYRSVLGAKPELLITSTDTTKFTQRLELLLSNIELASELHDWQQSQLKHYDVTKVGPQLIELYRQIIALRQTSGHN